ncbi:MAG: homoserine dehydrogenase, partial [Enterococcus italicus]
AVAKQFGYKIKLLGEVKAIGNELSLRVAPALVSDQTSLALIDNETNALQVNSTQIGQSFLSGPGAGAAPTATSVLADIQALIEKKELGTINQFTPVFFENLEFTFLAESPAEKMGIVMKKANASQKFTNDQLADIQSIHHVSIADDAYEWLVTNPLTSEQLHDLLESLNKMGSVLGALPFVD